MSDTKSRSKAVHDPEARQKIWEDPENRSTTLAWHDQLLMLLKFTKSTKLRGPKITFISP